MEPITIRYPVRPTRRSLRTGYLADLFGLEPREPPYTVVEDLQLDIRPGDLVLFHGPSGGGKSSLMRACAAQLPSTDALSLPLPEVPLVDALEGELDARLGLLAAAGLSEARLLLRTPSELSEGQRYRFRLAVARQRAGGGFVVADEFGAVLDRTLARVVAYNLRRGTHAGRGGALVATTHDDLLADLQPDLSVRCLGEGRVEVTRRTPLKRPISFRDELRIEEGTRADWPRFAAWHYRSHHLGYVQKVLLLTHGPEPIGICVFATPAASLKLRSQFFGLRQARGEVALQALNEQLWLLARVVLHPTYRGAGVASWFVSEACGRCPVPWVETLTAMGQVNPFFERAGFTRVGVIRKPAAGRSRGGGGAYGGRGARLSGETIRKSRYSEPVYYVRDNRRRAEPEAPPQATP